MKNWKRFLAAVGTATLIASNMGAVTQVVFASEPSIAENKSDSAGQVEVNKGEASSTFEGNAEVKAKEFSAEDPAVTERESAAQEQISSTTTNAENSGTGSSENSTATSKEADAAVENSFATTENLNTDNAAKTISEQGGTDGALTYTIHYEILPEDAGLVVDSAGNAITGDKVSFNAGDEVTFSSVKALANNGYQFVEWKNADGQNVSTTAELEGRKFDTRNSTENIDKTFTAVFEKKEEGKKKISTTLDDEEIIVEYGTDAMIPDNAALLVKPIANEDACKDAAEELFAGKNISLSKYYSLSIADENGKSVRPAVPVTVTIQHDVTDEDADVSVVKFDKEENGESTTVKASLIEDIKTDAESVSFDTDDFTTFGVFCTTEGRNISLETENDEYKVAIEYNTGKVTNIPEEATLRVKSYSRMYDSEYTSAKKAVIAVKKAEDINFNENTLRLRALGISLEDTEGRTIKPDGPVNVTLIVKSVPASWSYADIAEIGDQTCIVDDANVVVDGNTTAEFTTENLSTYAVYTEADKTTVTAKASDGATVEITGVLPDGASASINPVDLSDDELNEFFGKDVVGGIDKLVIYDISILVDGKEWEPDENVSVIVKNPAVEPVSDEKTEELKNKKVDAEKIEVSHLIENAETQVKTAEVLEQKQNNEADVVEFDTESFSLYGFYTYTVDYFYGENEFHQAGGSTLKLSELLEKLKCDCNVADVDNITFTNTDLIEIEKTEKDWNLRSRKLFNTGEKLTLTLKNGNIIEIDVTDAQYVKYEYSSNMKPYAGSFNYVGKYDIFGGGNGIAGRLSEVKDQGAGTWSFNGSSGDGEQWGGLRGHQVIDGTSTTLSGKLNLPNPSGYNNVRVNSNQVFISGSSASISWEGSIDRAFFSYAFLWSSKYYNTKGTMWVEITGPNKKTAYVQLDLDTVQDDPRGSDFVDNDPKSGDWRYLTFDATDFVNEAGKGLYSVKMTLYSQNRINGAVGDMGWSIYGVTDISSQPESKSAAIAGAIAEMAINGNTSGTATFESPITPSGRGKVWYNVHGGERKGFGSNTDYDSLEVIKTDNKSIYLGSRKVKDSGSNQDATLVSVTDQNRWQWDWEDIASPNTNSKIRNRFSFGLGTFETLSKTPITGVRKTQRSGNDVFGSVMILTEVQNGNGNAILTKKLGDGSDPLEQDTEFTFKVIPDRLNPSNDPLTTKSYKITLRQGAKAGNEGKLVLGEFNFTDKNAGNTYIYKIQEVDDKQSGWTYDSSFLTLECKVTYNSRSNSYEGTFTWRDANNNIIDAQKEPGFTNTYKSAGNLKITKVVSGNAEYTAPDKTYIINLSLIGAKPGEYETEDANTKVTFKQASAAATTVTGSVQLTNGQSVTIKGLPAGAQYTVVEDPTSANGYTVVYNNVFGANAKGSITAGETAEVTVENKISVIKTGVSTNNSPLITMTIIADGGVLAFVTYAFMKRRLRR